MQQTPITSLLIWHESCQQFVLLQSKNRIRRQGLHVSQWCPALRTLFLRLHLFFTKRPFSLQSSIIGWVVFSKHRSLHLNKIAWSADFSNLGFPSPLECVDFMCCTNVRKPLNSSTCSIKGASETVGSVKYSRVIFRNAAVKPMTFKFDYAQCIYTPGVLSTSVIRCLKSFHAESIVMKSNAM